ncbi:MAG: glycine betaine ABC transporter substrate-binding protein [Pseudomonadota bacterium]
MEDGTTLFEQLRRAHMFRYSGLYFAFAWGSITAVDVVGDNVSAPNWIEPVLVALWVTLFPLFLLLVWINRRKFITTDHPVTRGGFDIIIALIVGAIAIYSGIRLVSALLDPRAPERTFEFVEDTIRIGGKDFLEQSLLVELLAQKIENDNPETTAQRLHYVGETDFVLNRVTKGEIDLWVDYSGTILTQHLGKDRAFALDRSNHELRALNILEDEDPTYPTEILAPFGFSNNYTLVMRKSEVDQKLGANRADQTLSRLAEAGRSQRFTFGINYGSAARGDGLRGLAAFYDFDYDIVLIEHDDIYRMLDERPDVDFVLGFTTDPQLAYTEQYLELIDDREFWAEYRAFPLINEQYAARHPEIVSSISALEEQFTAADIRIAMRRIIDAGFSTESVKRKEFDIVEAEARRMLLQRGLIRR